MKISSLGTGVMEWQGSSIYSAWPWNVLEYNGQFIFASIWGDEDGS